MVHISMRGAEKIKFLEEENQRLRAELAQAKAEILALKKKHDNDCRCIECFSRGLYE